MQRVRDLTVLGVHPVEPTAAELEEALEIQWGRGLAGDELHEAKRHVREHFEGLYLIEVRLDPADSTLDWSGVTQPDPSQPESNWQVPYDEQPSDLDAGRWVFFLHFLDRSQPLTTPVGPRILPSPTPRPRYLAKVKYEVP